MPYSYLIPYPTAARPMVAMESRKHAGWWHRMRGKWREGFEMEGEKRKEGGGREGREGRAKGGERWEGRREV